jgi:signal transduction histidine kinase
MRRRVALVVAATTSAVVVAFVVPLCLLVRNTAEDRAMAAADQESRNIAILVSTLADDPTLGDVVAAVDERSPATTTVVLADGTRLGSGTVPAEDPDVVRGRTGEAFTHRVGSGARTVVPVVTDRGTDVVLTEVTHAQLREGVLAAWVAIGALGLLLLALASLSAAQLGRRISTPVTRVAEVAHRLREGDLAARAAPEGPPETRALAQALNRLAERIVELLAAERAATADLSHRLRTPVTALRIDVEGLGDPAQAERLEQHVATLQRTIDAIVEEARRPVRHDMASRCDAGAVVRARTAYWAPLAEDQRRAFRVDVSAADMPVGVDEVDLADLVDVLVDNVFAHTPEGTAFAVTLGVDADRVRLVVADEGPGPEPVRPGRPGHTGLGLEIVRRIVEPVGGSLRFGAAPSGGTVAEVVLPVHHEQPDE